MSAWFAVDALAAASLLGLLWMTRGLEVPSTIRRLIGPCIGGAALFALGDLAARALGPAPGLAWVALLVSNVGYMTLPPAWFLMGVYVAARAGSPAAARVAATRWRYLPAAVAAGFFTALATNPLHGLYLRLSPTGLLGEPGPLWWAHEAFACGVLVLCTAFSISVALQSAGESRKYLGLIGAALTTIGGAVFVLWPLGAAYGFSTRVLGIGTAGFLFLVSLLSQRLFFVRALSFADVRAQDADAVLLIDGLDSLVDANPPARELFPELASRTTEALARFAALLRPLEPERLAGRSLAEVLAGGTTPPGLRCELASGEGRVVRVTSSALRDSLGRLGALLVRVHDETPLFEAQRRFAEQAALLAAMWSVSGDAVSVTDRNNRVRYANEAMARLWGGTPSELEGRTVGEILDGAPVELRAAAREAWSPVANDFTASLEDERVVPDGRAFQRTSMPLYRDGELFGRFARIRDVTEERRSAEALREAAKLESLSVLAGGVAHDFNNLLTTVLGSAELAAREVPQQSRAGELLRDLRAAAERGAELASQLLAYAGHAQRTLALVDLSALIEERKKLVTAAVPPRIAVDFALARGLRSVRGDASQLTQVVMNLVLNAAEAIGDKPGRIGVETSASAQTPPGLAPQPDGWIALRVSDDGAGMTADTRARIFDPFFTTKPSGRGLGLASVRGIVGQHGGAIHVESDPGNGAVFIVLLPATRQRAERGAPPEAKADPRGASGASLLIVDDEPATLRVSRLTAESLGYVVTTATRPSEALATARERSFQLVLVDATMPECSGLQLLARLRASDPRLPAVVYSGFARESLDLPRDPPTEFLPKPFRREELEAALLRVLNARS